MRSVNVRTTVARWLDGLLRGRDHRGATARPASLRILLVIAFCCGPTYGAIMGCFAGRGIQMFYSAVKVPALFVVTFAVAMPAFFVLNTLTGLRDDFHDVFRALVATQAGVSVILMSLAPYTLLWYASTDNYASAVAFNAIVFAISSFAGQLLLVRYYSCLLYTSPSPRD